MDDERETGDGTAQDGGGAARTRRRRWMLSGLVLIVAATGVAITDATGRRDAALLFVGLPALLALAIALRPPARSLHGQVAAGTTFALLLTAILLQEGAICVVLSAPLVFGVAHGTAALARRSRHGTAVLLLPLLAFASTEGIWPAWRVQPEQTVAVTRAVAAPPEAVLARAADGPDFEAAPLPPLLRTGFPVPGEAVGDGLQTGDRWRFDYRGEAIVTEVVDRDADGVAFRLVTDTSKTARWLTWRSGALSVASRADGGSDVTIAITFERGLDPSWWFGPVEDALVRAGATYLLDAVTVPS